MVTNKKFFFFTISTFVLLIIVGLLARPYNLQFAVGCGLLAWLCLLGGLAYYVFTSARKTDRLNKKELLAAVEDLKSASESY